MVDALLHARNLMRRYGDRTAVDIAELRVHAGEVVAIVGPNGAGKSTLFRLLLLLERPDAGSVHIDGRDAWTQRDVRQRLAGVFQRPLLFSGTVRSNVEFGLRARRIATAERRTRAAEAIGWLGLDAFADRSVHSLSGGEAQRVALARALVTEPDVLLLDEPTASLDAAIRRRFRMDIERVARQRARAIVLITHDAADAFGIADRVVVLEGGRVMQDDSPDAVLLRPGSPFVAELSGAELALHGTVERVDGELALVRLGPDTMVWATGPADGVTAGATVTVAYRQEDVALSGAGAGDTSALNRLSGVVETVIPAGTLARVRVRCGPVALTALVTGHSLQAMGFAAGSPAVAHIKATALHVWRRELHP